MSNLFNIFAGVFGENATWLESSKSLADAKQRLSQISDARPGSYFIFSTSSGRVLYQIHAPSLADARYSEMKAARREWELAADELRRVLALFRDLNGSPASADGNLALRNARLREAWTLKKYRAAVDAYSAAEIALRKHSNFLAPQE